jgi:murein DD-endopeptidase MepM/ murein hydrolase activator NlpD
MEPINGPISFLFYHCSQDSVEQRELRNPGSNGRHRKGMKRKVVRILVLAVFATLLLINWSAISWGLSRLGDRLVLYVHVVQLYTKEPDRQISMPLPNVAKKEIANTWGAPRGSDRQHEGQDIFAPKGTPVLSATDGYVIRIGENNLGGKTVSVIGAGGRSYYYAHLDAYAPSLSEGDRVTRQTVLGFVGTTGNAQGTPPHLHFGIYASGGAINPLPLLTDRPLPATTRERVMQRTARVKK